MKADKMKDKGVLSSVAIGYGIVLFHVVLVLIIGVAVIFFRGVTQYMTWILGGGLAIILLSGYYFYRRLKAGALDIKKVLNDPAFRGREVEIKLLGGVASVKMGAPTGNVNTPLSLEAGATLHQLESPETLRMQELGRLVRMREDNLVTHEEYEQLKKDLLKTNEITITSH